MTDDEFLHGFDAGALPPAQFDHAAHLRAARALLLRAPFAAPAAEMIARMRGDKKNSGGKITLILARGIGRAFVARDMDEASLTDFLTRGQNGH